MPYAHQIDYSRSVFGVIRIESRTSVPLGLGKSHTSGERRGMGGAWARELNIRRILARELNIRRILM